MAEGAINLIADYFSAAPGTRQRRDVRAVWEEVDMTADWQLMALPGWCLRAGGRVLSQHGGFGSGKGCDISGHTMLSHTNISWLCQYEWGKNSASSPPRWERMYINRSICELLCSYSVLTQVPREKKCLLQVAQDHKPAALCGACVLNTNAPFPFSLLTWPLSWWIV